MPKYPSMTYTCGVAVIGSGVGCLANAAKVPLRALWPLCMAPLNVVTAMSDGMPREKITAEPKIEKTCNQLYVKSDHSMSLIICTNFTNILLSS